MANEPSRSRRSLDIADLASQFDEVQSTLEGFMQKARRSNEDQIQSLSDALYEEIRSLQVAVDEVDFKTVEVLKSKQGPPGPAGKTHFPGKTDCCNLFSSPEIFTPQQNHALLLPPCSFLGPNSCSRSHTLQLAVSWQISQQIKLLFYCLHC